MNRKNNKLQQNNGVQLKLEKELNYSLNNPSKVHDVIQKIAKAGLINAVFTTTTHTKRIPLLVCFTLRNDITTIQLLLDTHKADPLVCSEDGHNALFTAVDMYATYPTQFNLEIITELLKFNAKAQICQRNVIEKFHVVHFCITRNLVELLGRFLKLAPEALNLPTKIGSYPIHLICKKDANEQVIAEKMLQLILQINPTEQVLLKGEHKRLPIHILAQTDRFKLIDIILQHVPQAQLTATDGKGQSLLHMATGLGKIGLFGLLKKHNVLTNLLNLSYGESGQTALHIALLLNSNVPTNKNVKQFFVKALLETGAEVLAGNDGLIPLETCCGYDDVDIAKLLLTKETEAQLRKQTSEGYTPLHSCCYYGAVNMATYLLSIDFCQNKNYLLQTNNYHRTALHVALIHYAKAPKNKAKNFLTIIEKLLEYFPEEQLSECQSGQTPLMTAVADDSVDAVALLVNFIVEAQFLTLDEDGKLPIHLACDQSSFTITKLLLTHFFAEQLNSRHEGFTPLHRAIFSKALDIVCLILEKQPLAINDTFDNGLNIFHICAITGDLKLAQVFFEKAPHLLTKTDETELLPICLAAQYGHMNIVQFYLQHTDKQTLLNWRGVLGGSLLLTLIDANQFDMLKFFVEYGIPLDVEMQGSNILHSACAKGRLEMVKLLLTTNLIEKINTKTNDDLQSTPLLLAIEQEHEEIVELLCQHKADISLADALGRDAVFRAVIVNNLPILKLLVKYGASLTSILLDIENGGEPYTLLEIAEWIAGQTGNREIVKYLENQYRKITVKQQEETKNNVVSTVKIETMPTQTKALSGRSFLKATGYTEEQIQTLKNKSKVKVIVPNIIKPKKLQLITWCNHAFSSQSNYLVTVQTKDMPCYLYISENLKEETGLGKIFWQRLLGNGLKFSDKCIKTLVNPLRENIIFGNIKCAFDYKYELKIGDVERILLCVIPSDDKQVRLLVGARYLAGGLHLTYQKKALEMQIKSSDDLTIELPRDAKKITQTHDKNLIPNNTWQNTVLVKQIFSDIFDVDKQNIKIDIYKNIEVTINVSGLIDMETIQQKIEQYETDIVCKIKSVGDSIQLNFYQKNSPTTIQNFLQQAMLTNFELLN